MVERKIHPMHFLTKEEKERVVAAIREVESNTSGEIRVALDHKVKGDVLLCAQKVFEKLGMTRTKHRNGILIFLAVKDRAFAILGDQEIHKKLGDTYWKEAAAQMQSFFARDEFGAGLEAAIQETGRELTRHFPREKDEPNELPDKIDEN